MKFIERSGVDRHLVDSKMLDFSFSLRFDRNAIKGISLQREIISAQMINIHISRLFNYNSFLHYSYD